MFGLFIRATVIACAALLLSACGTRPKQVAPVEQVYEIRAVSVTANAGISHGMLKGIQRRMEKAIRDTHRPIPMPRAVMTIHVVGTARAVAIDGVRTQTEISVTLTDVPSGVPVLVRSFMVYSFTLDDRGADDAAAEAIAARLRVEYMLSQPAIRNDQTGPVSLSTRMRHADKSAEAEHIKPIVVPLATAKSIGTDQDPLLNSKTRVEPEKAKASVPASSLDTAKPTVVENELEAGARAKVVIKPQATEPAADEPCIETLETKC